MKRRASWLWVCAVVLAVAEGVLMVMGWRALKLADAYPAPAGPIGTVVYASLGAVIVRRVGNRIGWLLLGFAFVGALQQMASFYAVVGVVTHPGALPAAKVVGTLSEVIFIPAFTAIIYMLLIFPTGSLPSPRWRPVAVAVLALTALSMVGFIVTPRQVQLPAPGGVSLLFPNPLAVRSVGPRLSTVLLGTIPSLTLASAMILAGAAAALVVRYRSGSADLRQQIKWLAYATVAWVAVQVALGLAQSAAGYESPVTIVIGFASALLALAAIPVAITIAILRHRLYDIDLIINHTLVYGALTAILAGVYALCVVVVPSVLRIGHSSELLVAASTLLVAALFQPLRGRIQSFIDRRFYRSRYNAAQTVEAFSSRLRDEVDLQAMRVDLLTAVQETMQPRRASLWLKG